MQTDATFENEKKSTPESETTPKSFVCVQPKTSTRECVKYMQVDYGNLAFKRRTWSRLSSHSLMVCSVGSNSIFPVSFNRSQRCVK